MDSRSRLQQGIKVLFILAMLFTVYIFTDFSFNLPTPKSYQLKVPELTTNSPLLLKQDNLLVVIARYDAESISAIQSDYSGISNESSDYPLPLMTQGYFVALGHGTLLGCPLEINEDFFSETCSKARYDLLGRSLKNQHYPDLKIPQYTFNQDFSLLTIE